MHRAPTCYLNGSARPDEAGPALLKVFTQDLLRLTRRAGG